MAVFSVYLVTNSLNNKVYVGKTGNSVADRWTDHKSNARRGRAKGALYSAMRKYGEHNFTVETVMQFPTVGEANCGERRCILLMSSHLKEYGYNLTWGGDGVMITPPVILEMARKRNTRERKFLDKYLTHSCCEKFYFGPKITSPLLRARLSRVRKGRFGGDKHPMYGKQHTPETAERIRQANLGRTPWNKGIPFSEESRVRMSEAQFKFHEDRPDVKEKIKQSVSELWKNPEFRAKMKVSQDARYVREQAEGKIEIASPQIKERRRLKAQTQRAKRGICA